MDLDAQWKHTSLQHEASLVPEMLSKMLSEFPMCYNTFPPTLFYKVIQCTSQLQKKCTDILLWNFFMDDSIFHNDLFWICKMSKLFIQISMVAKGNTPTPHCNRLNMLAIEYLWHSIQPEWKSRSFNICYGLFFSSKLVSLQRVCSNSEGRLGTCRLMNVYIEQHCQLHRWPSSLGKRAAKKSMVCLDWEVL